MKLRQPLNLQTVPIPVGVAYKDESYADSLLGRGFFYVMSCAGAWLGS